MKDFSYIRAAISCVPVIGPFVAFYNAREVRQESDTVSKTDGVFFATQYAQANALNLAAESHAKTQNINGIKNVVQSLKTQKTMLKNRYFPLSEKGKNYAICGIAGNVLSIAALVGLTAYNILNLEVSRFLNLVCTGQIMIQGYNLYQHNRMVETLKPLPTA